MFVDLPPPQSRGQSVWRRACVREYGETVWAPNWMEGVQESSVRYLFFVAAWWCHSAADARCYAVSLSLDPPIAQMVALEGLLVGRTTGTNLRGEADTVAST